MSNVIILLPKYVLSLLNRLENAGYEAYAVGGCVRNSLLGMETDDYDITTNALPLQIKQVFSDMRIIDTGIKHGTVTIISDRFEAEITTYRTDGEYDDRRHPDKVTFVSTIEQDLSRRDFTVNALAYSDKRGLKDLFNGTEDLQNKILRCVGNPEIRFEEDALRILRALRFMAVYGFSAERETALALHKKKNLLSAISAERIQCELNKILCGKAEYLEDVLREYWDIFAVIIPEINDCHGFDQHSSYHNRDVWEHTITSVCSIDNVKHLRLTMLFHDLGKPAVYTFSNGKGHFKGHAFVSADICRRTMESLHYDSETLKKVLFLVERHDMIMTDDSVLIKKHLNKFGKELYFDLLKVHIADDSAKAPSAKERIPIYLSAQKIANDILSEGDCFSLKDLKINGNDLKAEGYNGVEIGKILDKLLDAVIENKCENSYDALINYIKCENLN